MERNESLILDDVIPWTGHFIRLKTWGGEKAPSKIPKIIHEKNNIFLKSFTGLNCTLKWTKRNLYFLLPLFLKCTESEWEGRETHVALSLAACTHRIIDVQHGQGTGPREVSGAHWGSRAEVSERVMSRTPSWRPSSGPEASMPTSPHRVNMVSLQLLCLLTVGRDTSPFSSPLDPEGLYI